MSTELVLATEEFVKAELAGIDASHDYAHIARVRATAASLATEEELEPSDRQLVELSALLHDIDDWKYSDSETVRDERFHTTERPCTVC